MDSELSEELRLLKENVRRFVDRELILYMSEVKSGPMAAKDRPRFDVS